MTNERRRRKKESEGKNGCAALQAELLALLHLLRSEC